MTRPAPSEAHAKKGGGDRRTGGSIVVFLGPSLDLPEALDALPTATFRPPAAMGDIYSAVTAGAEVIALIDGLFERVPAVWHKEILFALTRGVRVVAGASMGALRAAETYTFGTEGVGTVFEWYRDEVLEDDEEVAVAHATYAHGFRPLSDAMVSIRWGLAQARDRCLISMASHEQLVAASKARHYPDRTWKEVLADATRLEIDGREVGELARFIQRERPDIKRKDAIDVLRVAGQARQEKTTSHDATGFTFEPTEFWHKLVDAEQLVDWRTERTLRSRRSLGRKSRTVKPAGQGESIRRLDIVHHTMLAAPDRDEVREHALNLALRSAELDRRRPVQSSTAVPRAPRSVSRPGKRLLLSEDDRLLEQLRAAPAVLIPLMEGRFIRYIQLALVASGRLSKAVAELRAKRRFLLARGTPEPTVADTGVSSRTLLTWYERKFGRIRTTVDEHAVNLGFSSAEHFRSELAAQYLFERRPRKRAKEGPEKNF